jgi:hypothetical protein
VEFVGCEACGLVENRNAFYGGRPLMCPDCGQPLEVMSKTRALELVGARAEAAGLQRGPAGLEGSNAPGQSARTLRFTR